LLTTPRRLLYRAYSMCDSAWKIDPLRRGSASKFDPPPSYGVAGCPALRMSGWLGDVGGGDVSLRGRPRRRSGGDLQRELLPLPGQQLMQAALRQRGDAGKDSQACGSTSLSFAVMISVNMTAARSAPRSEPANSHAFLPRARPRNARSAELFVRLSATADPASKRLTGRAGCDQRWGPSPGCAAARPCDVSITIGSST